MTVSRSLRAAVLLSTGALVLASCSGGSNNGSSDHGASSTSKGEASGVVESRFATLKQYGWAPEDNSIPNFNCDDNSYEQAVKNGITLGIYADAPYTYLKKGSDKPAGIDWDINMAVLAYIGITKYKAVVMQPDGAIPALRSGRVDVIAVNYHENPERLKAISFTGPAWYYGAVILTQKGNPGNINSWKDLLDPDVTVAVQNASASQAQLEAHGVKPTIFKTSPSLYQAMEGGRHTAAAVDAAQAAAYLKKTPNSNLEVVDGVSQDIFGEKTGYGRYGLRKDDCTLNYAWSRALAELRSAGVVSKILQKWNLDPKTNLMER